MLTKRGAATILTALGSPRRMLARAWGRVLAQRAPAAPPPERSTVTRSPRGERRQLTVLFCDVVDSTILSSSLDPEDLREVIRAFQGVCADSIQRFDGSIAQYLGDGVLAYFGYPQAHEDDAQHAAHTALAIIEALGALNDRLHSDYGIRLSARVAAHTGLVVIGEIGAREHRENLALGETPNVAAHLQGLAAPNTLVVSGVTHQLIRRDFETEDLGRHAVKGIPAPMPLYRVVRPRVRGSQPEIVRSGGLTPLVGREEELRLLLKRWEQVCEGAAHVVVLSGEAGIGKSRIVQTLKASVLHEQRVVLECRASTSAQQTALFPVAELVQQALQWQPDDTPAEQLRKLETALSAHHLPLDELVPVFAEFLSIRLADGRYPHLASSATQQRRKMFEALVTMLLARAVDQPVLFIVEDLDRLDPSTLEFLALVIERMSSARLYVILTCRPTFQLPWPSRAALTHLTLPRLSSADTEVIIAWITDGKALPAEVRSILRDKTEGVPLFIEEMTRAVLASGVLRETDRGYVMAGPLAAFTIPTTLHGSLTARLDRLGASKEIAQWGAVIGRQFSYGLLRALLPYDPQSVREKVGLLVQADVLYRQDSSSDEVYVFKHSLLQEAAYQSLLKSARQLHHLHVARTIESLYADDLEPHLLDLAYHLISAGPNADPDLVARYGRSAGDRALTMFAWREAAYFHSAALAAGERAACLTPEQRAELHYLVGFASFWDGDVRQCLDHYERAIQLYRGTNDIRGLAKVLAKKIALTVVSSYGGTVEMEPLEEVLGVLGEDDPRLCAHLLLAMAQMYWTARQPNQAETMARRALDIGTRLHDDDICARASFDIAMAQAQSLWLGDALESYRGTRQYARRSRNLWFEGWPLQRMPSLLFQLGRFAEASLIAEDARDFASKTNNWGHYSLTTGILTCMAVAKGEFALAERYGQETMDLVAQYRFPYGGALALPALACAETLRGNRPQAESALHTLMEPGRVFENPEPTFGPMTQVYRRLIRLHVDADAGAGPVPVAHLLDALGTGRFDITSLAPYCALIELGEPDKDSDVIAYVETQLSSAVEEGVLFSRGWVFCLSRVLGVAATMRQQWHTAERRFEQAARITTDVGAGPELGLTWLNYAQMLARRGAPGDPARADELLTKAAAVFRKFGMRLFAELTAKALDEPGGNYGRAD